MKNTPEGSLPPIRVVVITGTIGAGKTTIAEYLSGLLKEEQIRHALIDLDWLGQVYPMDEADVIEARLATENLSSIWPNFRATGIRCAIVAATLETVTLFNAIKEALAGEEVTVALVTAPAKEVAKRITNRELGSMRDDFLQKTYRLAATIESHNLHAITVRNSGTPLDAARSLLEKLGWAADPFFVQ